MLPLLMIVPALAWQAPSTPLPEVEAKDLAPAPRGPMVPEGQAWGPSGDLSAQTRRAARQGPSIPALQLPACSVRVKDKIPDWSGWRAYAVDVPAGGSVKAHVVEGRKAWFRVAGVNAWGRLEEGLLQNRIQTGEPQATYKNPTSETRTIYFIVVSLDENPVGDPFTVEITRS